MPNEGDLQKRARNLRREIAGLERAIAKMSAFNQEDRREELETLRTVRGLRERELNDIEGQLAGKG
jgi:hypothetical protein